MNILLATYGYYPYNWGGTEVYVSGLANYLLLQGHTVTIIATMPLHAFEHHPLFYEDEHIKAIQYYCEHARIIGVVIKHITTAEIYTKFNGQWVHSWLTVVNEFSVVQWDLLHMHANTPAIGKALVKAVQLHSEKIKVIASYHVPVSCAKGTLLFARSMEACTVSPSVNVCTACVISDKQKLPLQLSTIASALLPSTISQHLPTALRIKGLVKEFIRSFNAFSKEVTLWHVFSEQIKSILTLNGIYENNVLLLRHGVNPVFFEQTISSTTGRMGQPVTIFLYAGRFDKMKGFFTLLTAWCGLPETSMRKLWMAGEEQSADVEVTGLISRASQRKDIEWLGAQNQEALSSVMKKVHCTIIPSEWLEIGPLVFHEAIAAGSDVIASDMGGCKELANLYRSKSTLFNAGNVSSLRKKIVEFKYSGKTEAPLTRLQNYQQVLQSYNEVLTG